MHPSTTATPDRGSQSAKGEKNRAHNNATPKNEKLPSTPLGDVQNRRQAGRRPLPVPAIEELPNSPEFRIPRFRQLARRQLQKLQEVSFEHRVEKMSRGLVVRVRA